MSTLTLTTAPPAVTVRPTPAPARVRAVPALTRRRLALMVRSPRALLVPLMGPVMFALVVAPALAKAVAAPAQRNGYMTFFCIAVVGLLVPLSCMFSGLGVLVDREQGAMRDVLAAPIRRASVVAANLVAAVAVTALQVVVLVAASAVRGASYQTSWRVLWFAGAATLLTAFTYGAAEILAARLTSPEEYTGAIPAIAIVPFFFGGSLYPITALPRGLADVAKVLPLTHALALFRYGLTADGTRALHNIWGLSSGPAMAGMSLGVLAVSAAAIGGVAVRVFASTARQ